MNRFAFVILTQLGLTVPALPAEHTVLTGSVENISSAAWTISGFDSLLELTDTGLRGDFRIARISLFESEQTFDDVRLACGSISLTNLRIVCASATLTASIPGAGRQEIPGHFSYNRLSETAAIELDGIAIPGGRVRVGVTVSDAGIEARYSGTRMALDGLFEFAATFDDTFADYASGGLANVTGTLSAPADRPVHVRLFAEVTDAALANGAGTVAADGVTGRLDLDILFEGDTTRFNIGFDSSKGEAYLEPVYANFSDNELTLQARDVVTSDFSVYDVADFDLQQKALLDAAGTATLAFPADATSPPIITAAVELRDAAVANLYTNLIKITMAGTVFGDLETDGRLSGNVSFLDSELQSADLKLSDVILDDRAGRFAIYGLQGAFGWSADENQAPSVSRFGWDSATAHGIAIGGNSIELELGNDDVRLLAPVRLATLGGALLINQLELRNFGSDAASGTLDAELEPVQLGQLSGAFGWPAFSGTLSGRLPLLQLAEDTITVGGTLSARAFDGTIEVSSLRIEQPFGRVPRMQGDLAIRNLDLERLTEVFSFGLIQGRLSGDVAGLQLESWRPVAMDMRFYTPADDKSRHRISQRAVENLASVGGGSAAAALSGGFLKFFDVFAYDQIGLRCVLSNGVCAMSGIAPASSGAQGNGYYLVKGSGLPRIDVVGFRDTVSWPRLVQQLVAITQSGSPTVN